MSYTTKLVLIDGQEVEVKIYPPVKGEQKRKPIKKQKHSIKGKMK